MSVLAPSRLGDFFSQYLAPFSSHVHRNVEMVCALMTARCLVTQEHLERTAIYADGMAEIFGLSRERRRALRIGALLHDVGKMGVPDEILHKPGRLTAAEFNVMKLHPQIGEHILAQNHFPVGVTDCVRWHHERWGGRGYPDGLKGKEIPITARILAVVDCYDAVREDRPYRAGMDRQEAIDVLRCGSETMFEPLIVKAFVQNLHKFEREIERHKVSYTPSRIAPSTLTAEARAVEPPQGLDPPPLKA